MLIVLEGCDGTGKTTLAEFLKELLNAEIIHCSTHTPNDYHFFSNIISKSRTKNIIADRWCYGQFVYQKEGDRPLRRIGSVQLGDSYENLAKLEMQMLEDDTKIILVDAPTEIIKKRLAARNETLINGLTVEDIQQGFRELKNRSLLTWLEYNTGGNVNVQ